MTQSNFVTIGKDDFEAMLHEIDGTVELVSGNEDTSCWEYVYGLPTTRQGISVHIYSTVDKRTGHTRAKGADAIRVVFWDDVNDRPVGKGKKILRVEGATTVSDRIKQRVAAFFETAHTVSIIDFGYVRAVLEDNDENNFARNLLGKLDTYNSLTDGQLAYVLGDKTPKGWDTYEAKSKKRNPAFSLEYSADSAEEEQEEQERPVQVQERPEYMDPSQMVRGLVCEHCGSAVYSSEGVRSCGGDPQHVDIMGMVVKAEPKQATEHTRMDTGAGMEVGQTIGMAMNGRAPVGGDSAIERSAVKGGRQVTSTAVGGRGQMERGQAGIHYDATILAVELDEHNLLATSAYPFHRYPFLSFNPVQTATAPYADKDCNLIIGANTSSGKTICAEMLMDYTLFRPDHNRVIYLSPLKSLTQEKYDDWQQRFPDKTITILTGDYTLSDSMKAQLAASHIVVMTSEMCDSRTRRMRTEKNFWLSEVGLVIVDESHILSTDRGHAVECGIMRFTSINKHARVLFLSATMPNCDELGEWITKMNGKPTEVVYSTWRPVTLEMHFMGHRVIDRDYWATQEGKRQMVVDIVMGRNAYSQGKELEKYLVFCHDKGTGRNLVKRLEEEGVAAHFHNADLDMTDRLEIERSFEDRDGGLRVLVSTSTLAWGRNLPARNVVVVGVHRGMQEVDELDIIQMSGRAGRYGIDDAGTVFVICPQGSEQKWAHTFQNPRPVTSVLNNRSVMAFHVLAEIENKEINGVTDLMDWYERSLAGHQAKKVFDNFQAERLFDELRDMEMIETKDGKYMLPSITGLGRVSAWLYFSPYDVFCWYQNFSKYFSGNLEQDDMTLAWAVGDVTSNDWGYVPRDMGKVVDDWTHHLRNKGVHPGGGICSAVAAHFLITGAKGTGTARQLMRSLVFDIRRITRALSLIDEMYAQWDEAALWDILPQRVMYGVSKEMVELTRVPGIGGATARKLYERGVTTLEALADQGNFQVLTRVVTPTKAAQFIQDARKLCAA